MTETQLIQLKQKVDKARETVTGLRGEQTAQMKQLAAEWACKTIQQAENKVESMTTEIDKLIKQINEAIEELDAKYNS